MYKTILVPHERLPDAARALERAADLAKSLDADLLVLGIFVPPPAPVLSFHVDSQADERTSAQLAELHEQSEAWLEEKGLRAKVETQAGNAVHVMAQFARGHGVDLIVLGDTSDAGSWGRLLEHSSERVGQQVGCDVLIVR